MTKTTLVESVSTLKPNAEGIYEIRLIGANVQGSSGYYSSELLERDGAAAWPANTKVFIDHPSLSQAEDRPERSVRDIAGFTLADPELREDGLYSKVKFGKDHQQFIEDFHPILGMSVRAPGEVEESEDESGTIIRNVTAIYPSPLNSVDVVTAPGAQGAIIGALHESFRGTPKTEDTERTVQMDEKDIERIVEALKPLFVTLAETLQPEAPKVEETTEPNLAAVTESAIEAGLTKSGRTRVVEAVKAGKPVEEAIEAEKDYAKQVLAEAATSTQAPLYGVVHPSGGDTAARFNALFGGK